MNNTTINCPKCEREMRQGFIPDAGHSAVFLANWHEGNPKKSFWRGTRVSLKDGLPIRAFRCSGCGFLELYADKQFAAT